MFILPCGDVKKITGRLQSDFGVRWPGFNSERRIGTDGRECDADALSQCEAWF